ncbi:efflux RND transporter permease subunit [Veronia pacifica]|uniref:Acriflavin resistance protein n=1 Tax=Veronia pacifica TaxID=1080227 RepID=A0A1C3EGU4_9GAMM|nr:efflux RND transporter permease subunit [Veronia pacifica]ODA32443.1 acriflavin resistance protein [Veronia pacifica]
MRGMIDASLSRTRTMVVLLVCLFIAGAGAYLSIPKEANPDIKIPVIYVSANFQGISPADSERLLIRPIEQELRSIEGVKEMTSTASEGHGSVTLDFNVGVNLDKAMTDVREAVDKVTPRLPDGADKPTVNEVTLAAQMPVLSVALYGTVPERTLVTVARKLRDELEGFKQVLEVDIAGDRDDVVEVVVDPLLMESYNLVLQDIFNLISNNNRVIAAGFVDNGNGRFSVKVPSVFETVQDVLDLPVKVNGKEVVTFGDIASIRRTFRDPESFARLDGQPSVVMDVKKRAGENIIETVGLVKAVIAEAQKSPEWPDSLLVKYTTDESKTVKMMLTDLQNNILSAIILVVVVIVAILGARTALLVGISIPGSFLTGLLVLAMSGFTVNIVVLFSLIMAVGMLVDGAIVVTEFADRRMREGVHRSQAYREAAKRMAWPIIASTATTLAAFAPMLFWPDTVGEFMRYLPLTLIATLTASLVMALLFIPVLGSLLGKPRQLPEKEKNKLIALENGDFSKATGFTRFYLNVLQSAIKHPFKILLLAVAMAGGTMFAYQQSGLGTEFFPDVDPEVFNVKVRSDGDLSIYEKHNLMKEVEQRVLGMDEIQTVYTKTGGRDQIGVIQMKPVDWQYRRKVKEIIEELREKTSDLAGVQLEFKSPDAGPPSENDLNIQFSAKSKDDLEEAVRVVKLWIENNPAFINVSDTADKAGIDWSIDIDRADAARFGASASLVGNTVQFVTNGLKIGDYLPDDSDKEVDILVRYPEKNRDIGSFDELRVNTPYGMVPITNFATVMPELKQGSINRIDGERVLNIRADMANGFNLSTALPELQDAIKTMGLPEAVSYKIRGQDEEQQKSMVFLANAFIVALAVMAMILVTQFNSFYQAFLILSAVLFSTVGVFLGLLVFQRPFGVIMSGIGVITLAGIVVNNNIVLIDTYNVLRRSGLSKVHAILSTGAQRLRPVMLTTVTTILGLLPMVLEMNIDLINQKVEFGAPSTQWWSQLATAVSGGLAFSTLLTLILTPCLLMLGGGKVNVKQQFDRFMPDQKEGLLRPDEERLNVDLSGESQASPTVSESKVKSETV